MQLWNPPLKERVIRTVFSTIHVEQFVCKAFSNYAIAEVQTHSPRKCQNPLDHVLMFTYTHTRVTSLAACVCMMYRGRAVLRGRPRRVCACVL